ncbi:Follicle cell protein 3C-1 [Eumeta japonica]|uniref:Follicle cell protein 3C-1 n=1 Tax=Eumeta variegata TaxID=151549 RepID=A0A4C1U928_EUMVA|nr:Follicle cell protein 3C-1 [Eumeta japonica]
MISGSSLLFEIIKQVKLVPTPLSNFRLTHVAARAQMVKYLPRAGTVICGAVERDVRRERAYLYVGNCRSEWTPTSFSAGKEFCCTDGQHHKC